uniref:PDZ domain-containing protein n=1 Tax=Bursaphelenchus xylophilus TaxID=6326 RepID=A0A1I7S861_BURXY
MQPNRRRLRDADRNVFLRTKRNLVKKILRSPAKMAHAKLVLKRRSMNERLGIGIAIETNDLTDRVVSVRVEQIEEGSVAHMAGLEAGDRILEVDGQEVHECNREECLSLFQNARLQCILIILPGQFVDAIHRMNTTQRAARYHEREPRFFGMRRTRTENPNGFGYVSVFSQQPSSSSENTNRSFRAAGRGILSSTSTQNSTFLDEMDRKVLSKFNAHRSQSEHAGRESPLDGLSTRYERQQAKPTETQTQTILVADAPTNKYMGNGKSADSLMTDEDDDESDRSSSQTDGNVRMNDATLTRNACRKSRLSESEDSAVPHELASLSPISCSSGSDQWKHEQNQCGQTDELDPSALPVRNLILRFDQQAKSQAQNPLPPIRHRSQSQQRHEFHADSDEIRSEASSENYEPKMDDRLKILTLTPPRTLSESSFVSTSTRRGQYHSPLSSASSTHQPSNNQRLLSQLDKEANFRLNRRRHNFEEKPTEEQLAEIRQFLGASFEKYHIFGVTLNRPAGYECGSVGLLLISPPTTNQISIQRVTTASIADRDDRMQKGDLVFYIHGEFTGHMDINDARTLLKSEASSIPLIIGREMRPGMRMVQDQGQTFEDDPNLYIYSEEPVEIVLEKCDIGVGFSLTGGEESHFGRRPIVVKKIFLAGEAAKCKNLAIGDEIRRINDQPMQGMTQIEAWNFLKSRPTGPIRFQIHKLIARKAQL